MNGIILDLCGGSGSWSKPYREAGYAVINCTLPEIDICETAFYDDYMVLQNTDTRYTPFIRYRDVIGILAAPPCTEFSIAKSTAPRDFVKGMKVVRACLDVVWHCQCFGNLQFWALENPRGLLKRFLGQYAFVFEQWQFGGTLEKPTCLWGVFNPPIPTVKEKPHIEKFRNKIDNQNLNSREYASPKCPPEYADYVGQFKGYQERRAAIRAITPEGFAKAFYKANKPKGGSANGT